MNPPIAVSAETHGDFWEDDMDYSETVSYEGVETKASAQSRTDEKTGENCPPEGKESVECEYIKYQQIKRNLMGRTAGGVL